jgi:hypothetical protein
MIIVRLKGGMGNQMFQYAFGRALSLKYNTPLKLDLSFLKNKNMGPNFVYRDYDLNLYNISEDFDFTWDEINVLAEPEYGDLSFNQKFVDFISNNFNKKIMIDGYWQTVNYFLGYEDQIKNDFEFRDKVELSNNQNILDMYNKINNSNSVLINVRRTDFLNGDFHGVMGMDYINNAVDIIKSKVDNIHFFVFSDDIEWCQENIKFDNMTIVDHSYKGDRFGYYLQLMKSCKHFIIPNSSFAWWSAWLSQSENKIVIAPKKWLNSNLVYTNDLIPSDWIRI